MGDRLVTVNALLSVRERATIKKLAADMDRRQQEVMAELVRLGLAQELARAEAGVEPMDVTNVQVGAGLRRYLVGGVVLHQRVDLKS